MHAHGPLAGQAGVLERPGGLPGGRDLAEVAGQLGDVGPGAGAVQTLDRLPDPPVQLDSNRDRQPLVQHLSHQGVREAIPADGARLLDHAKGDRLRQRVQDALGRQLAGGPQQLQVELPAHHRGNRQHTDRVRRQRGKSPTDHRPHAARDRHPNPAGPLHGGLGGQQADHLPDKQRVALGPLIDGGGLRLGGHHPREHLDEVLHLVAAQPTKGEQLPLADQLLHRLADTRLTIGPCVAVGPHDQQPDATKAAHQELQQQQGRLIGRMQILEDQQQRLYRRRLPEEAGNRLEQVEARRIRLTREHLGDRGHPKAFGKTGNQLGDLDRSGPQPGSQGLLVTVFDQGAK